ncbi:TetR/AcrR family transcriptional regulator [Mycobacterium deserti]|uniref:TetR/AcrR family transcriptional regulator n=1 Tax=Mycobacterium deserti TaxID=2978347 RepID=A0ABT2M8K5_9MYCO|nr:TetR/AcrR family transcriptional regulator [Mycobacterium deserti]MCT7658596.1 TetR/AcrR family transcriptional regulator [Mycobacterium deserti]
MSPNDRPLRADAARNRARLLQVAYDAFAAEGLAVPIDEIARRAGVGAGTVYRHFPTKDDLFSAVVDHRLRRIVDEGRALAEKEPPETALVVFLRSLVLQFGATDRGLKDALSGAGVDVETVSRETEDAFKGVLRGLLEAGQNVGAVRRDVDADDVKALLVGCLEMQAANPPAAERLTDVVLDGLKA